MKRISFTIVLLVVVIVTMMAQDALMSKNHEDAFLLAKKVMTEKLGTSDETEAKNEFVISGITLANTYMSKKEEKFKEARNIFQEILPYACEEPAQLIRRRIAYCWYMEGTLYEMRQQHGMALNCLENARQGYHELSNVKDETMTLCEIGYLNESLLNFGAANRAYQKAEKLAETSGNGV